MVDAAPFRALRYDPAIAGDALSTSAPAYDDVGRFTYARHRTASPYTVLELLAQGSGADAYRAAGAAFSRWRRTGVVVEDPQPAFYLYDIHELRHGVPVVVRGILAAVAVGTGDLLAHERVDASRVADRARRLTAVPVDLAPVFAVAAAMPARLRAMLDAPPRRAPLLAMTDEVGADHRIWRLGEAELFRDALRGVKAVIADGHHRYQAAVHLRERNPAAGRVLVYLADASVHGPQLRAVHRLVRAMPPDVLDRLGVDFTVDPVAWERLEAAVTGCSGPAFGLRLAGRTLLLAARDPHALSQQIPADHSPTWRSLDTAVWETVVRSVVGGEVEYRGDPVPAAAEADADPATGLFLLRPPSMDAVYACAQAGEAMPVKTTWFRPKPRAGLLMRSLDSGG